MQVILVPHYLLSHFLSLSLSPIFSRFGRPRASTRILRFRFLPFRWTSGGRTMNRRFLLDPDVSCCVRGSPFAWSYGNGELKRGRKTRVGLRRRKLSHFSLSLALSYFLSLSLYVGLRRRKLSHFSLSLALSYFLSLSLYVGFLNSFEISCFAISLDKEK